MHPEAWFNLAIWAVTALNSGVAVSVYLFRRRPRSVVQHSAPTAAIHGLTAAAIVCLLEEAVVISTAGPFGAICLVQYNLALPTAAVGATILIERLRKESAPSRARDFWLASLLILPAIVIAHSAFVAPYRLQVERADVEVKGILREESAIRVVVLADLQTDRVTAHEQRAIDLALAEEPDLILMPGDLFHVSEPRWKDRKPQFRALIERIQAPHGVFAVEGNVDIMNRLRPFLDSSPVRMLENEVVAVDVRGVRVAIGGVELNFTSLAADAAIDRLVQTDADIRILLAHYPDTIESLRVDGIDLVVAGHTHGGQVVIPGFGPPMTLSGVPRHVAAGGLHTLGGDRVYVSRGIGMERGSAPPVRFFCPPEISVLTLR